MDNAPFQSTTLATLAAGFTVAGDSLTYSGDTALVQVARLVHVSGAEGSKAVAEIVLSAPPITPTSQYGLLVREVPPLTARLVTNIGTNTTSIKASAGWLKAVHVFVGRSSALYIKFHNTVPPTAGTGVVWSQGFQAGQARDIVFAGAGKYFSTGIGMTVVTGILDTDTGAVAIGDAVIEVEYE